MLFIVMDYNYLTNRELNYFYQRFFTFRIKYIIIFDFSLNKKTQKKYET